MDATSFWALLVGIDNYAAVNSLQGSVNDVEAMKIFLESQLNFPSEHILVLKNSGATRVAILKAFQEFLIDNEDIPRGAEILFHYSGHGSQMIDPSGVEPDGYSETIVPQDSRQAGVFDIPDKTISALLDRLAEKKGERITVILDSCHSGSGTRRLEGPGVARVRRLPADGRPPPPDLDANLRAGTPARGDGPSGWPTEEARYVLLAGCRDRELAYEYWAKGDGEKGAWHGALTYFALQALQQMGPGTTYEELHERIAARVHAAYPAQMPQCEGDRTRTVFGGARVERDAFIRVEAVDEYGLTLAAGLVHGLRPGTELEIYPSSVRTRTNLPTAKAIVEVVSASGTSSRARAVKVTAGPIQQLDRGLITRQVYAGLRRTVALIAAEGEANESAIERLRDAIAGTSDGKKPSPYLTVLDNPAVIADLRVVAASGRFTIHGPDGNVLVVPEDIRDGGTDVVAVRNCLESIVRYKTLVALENQEAGSQLQGRITIRLRHAVLDPAGQLGAEELPADATSPGGEISLEYHPGTPEFNRYIVDVANNSDKQIYINIFLLNPDYSVQPLYLAADAEEALRAGGVLSSGLSRGRLLEIYLPDQPRWDSCRDTIRVIATSKPADLRWLVQDGLNEEPLREADSATRSIASPLDELLNIVVSAKPLRFCRPSVSAAGDDWGVAELVLTVVRASRSVTLGPDSARVTLGDGLTLVKPAGFKGQVTLVTWGQATRGSYGDPGLKPPPGLAGFPEYFKPVERPGTRGDGPPGVVIAFEVDEESRRTITRDNPLRLELPDDSSDAIAALAVAFDGEDYLIGGSSDNSAYVDISRLPPAIVPVDAQGSPTARGILRTIRLFVYKKLGRATSLAGLHLARIDQGQVVYEVVRREQFRAGQRVALFVHGFTSDSRWMISGPAQFLQQQGVAYDHCLAWDYETFGTSIDENGSALALALQQQCGLGRDDNVTLDVFAHSMGSLVSRSMIELHGGAEFVDCLLMAGPPNRGSALANINEGFVYLLTVAINSYTGVPPLAWAIRRVYEEGIGLSDLKVGSDILNKLNSLSGPGSVPYLVLAGTDSPEENERGRLRRLAQKVMREGLETVFGEPNDVAVGISSLRGVRGGSYTDLKIVELACDHFHYFVVRGGQEAIKDWVMKNARGGEITHTA
jgi:hypothetical protein